MHHNPRQKARNLKRATPVYVTGAEARFSANDEPEPGVTDCVRCRVCGGAAKPRETPMCDACLGLAATFARITELLP